jgi:hypothetical protein
MLRDLVISQDVEQGGPVGLGDLAEQQPIGAQHGRLVEGVGHAGILNA